MFKQDNLPYVDEELIKYLKETYSLQNVTEKKLTGDTFHGYCLGVAEVMNRLEAILAFHYEPKE